MGRLRGGWATIHQGRTPAFGRVRWADIEEDECDVYGAGDAVGTHQVHDDGEEVVGSHKYNDNENHNDGGSCGKGIAGDGDGGGAPRWNDIVEDDSADCGAGDGDGAVGVVPHQGLACGCNDHDGNVRDNHDDRGESRDLASSNGDGG